MAGPWLAVAEHSVLYCLAMKRQLAVAWIGLGSACGWSVTHDLILSTGGSGEPPTADGVSTRDASTSGPGSSSMTPAETDALPSEGCTDRWGQPGWGFEAPVLLAELSSSVLEADPRLSADGLMLSFASDRPGGAGGFDLYLATRAQPSDPFGAPVPQDSLNTEFDETSLSWIDDGSFVFASSRGTAGQWSTLWQGTPTATLSPLDALSLPNANNYDPFVSADGLRLYWTVANSGSDASNLQIAQRAGLGDSFEPLGGPSFESTAYDDSLTVTGDGRVALWGSERPGGLAVHDLWFATRTTPDGDFGAAVLVPDINSDAQDRESFVSIDGCTVLFVSDRPGGVGEWDIYMAEVRRD